MKKSVFTTIICLLVTISAFAYSGGNGTEQYPYLISSKANMEELATNVNGGQKYAGVYFLLTRDLTGVDDVISTIIGTSNTRYFSGVFDGDGHEIKVIINSTGQYVGVFGYIASATIKNLGVIGSVKRTDISSTVYAGGVCGYVESGAIFNCYNAGDIQPRSTSYYSSYAGGICGYASLSSSITDCYNVGAISSNAGSSSGSSGGICGYASSITITNSYNVGFIISTTGSSSSGSSGGICGYASSITITNSYNVGNVSSNCYSGGICGRAISSSSITNSYNVGNISSNAGTCYSGGICGEASSITITNSYNVGNIVSTSSGAAYSPYSGGICGHASAGLSDAISNCYNVGNISSTTTSSTYSSYSGGICGYVVASNGKVLSIINCIAANATIIAKKGSNNSITAGRILGGDSSDPNYSNYSIQNCYASATMQINNVTRSSEDASSKDGKDWNNEIIVGIFPFSTCAHTETSILIKTTNPLKWQRSDNNGGSWTDIACKSIIYTESNLSAGHYIYRAQNGNGTFSPYVEVTYQDTVPTKINTLPLTGATKTVDESITFSLELQDDNYNYQWYRDNMVIEDATTNTLDIDIIKSANAGIYKCKVWHSCNEVYSETSMLTVNKCPQVITFPEIPIKIYGEEAISLPEKTDKGLTITYQSTNANVATISGNILTLKALGTSTIIASQAGNADYLLAPAVERTLTINKQNQTITFGEIAIKRYGDPAFNLPAATDKGLTISYQIINANVATVAGNTVTIHNTGSTQITATQEGNNYCNAAEPVTRTLIIDKAVQTIEWDNQGQKTYGDEAFTLNAQTNTGFPVTYTSSDPSKVFISGNQAAILGAGNVTITVQQAGSENYLSVSDSKSFTVSKAPLTITAENKQREQGENNPQFTLLYSGFKNNENESVLDVLPTIACEANSHSPIGIYDIVLSGGSDNNYNYNLINGKLEIITPTGLEEINSSNVSIYPNPAKDYLYIQSDKPVERIEIYNSSGLCILSKDNGCDEVAVSAWANGFYLVRIYVDGVSLVRKIIVE